MPFSYVTRSGDGNTTSFTFSFTGQDEGYIREEDIVVLVDGASVPFILTSANTLETDTAPPSGTGNVIIRRVMPKDLTYGDFRTGNNFGQEILNNSFLQSLYVIQEVLDGWFPENFQFLTDVGFAGNVTYNGFDIDDVGTLTVDEIIVGQTQLSAQDILNEAYDWAQYPVDQLVPEGNGVDEYSAYHYSVKAEGSADDANGYATSAAISAGSATRSQNRASDSADAAAASEANAATSETNASSFASAAATSETNAETSESNAADSASSAATSESNAATSESDAADSASAASTSESNAADSASAAATSASNASASESAASASESAAATSEANALASEQAAATSESNAATSADNALSSENAAATSESNAATSESNAADSASSAATSASNAADSESNAATSESNAASSAANAALEASDAKDSEEAAFSWANWAEDNPVPTGNGSEYSAYHYARKAEASLDSITANIFYADTLTQLSSLVTSPNDGDDALVSGTLFRYDGGASEWLPRNAINAMAYGATGDGVTNDAQAIQDALDAAANNAVYHVYLPSTDDGYFVTHGVIDMPPYTTLSGNREVTIPDLYNVSWQTEFRKGVCLVVDDDQSGSTSTANPVVRMRNGATFQGINVLHLNQVETNPPNAYPPVFYLEPKGANVVNIRDLVMFNPYIGIDATGGHQNLNVIDVYMQPLRSGIKIDEATQVDRLTRVDIGGIWHRRNFFDVWDDPSHVVYYMQGNCVGIEVGRADDFVFTDCLLYGVNIGVAVGMGGKLSYGKINNVGFDYNQYCFRSNAGINENGIVISDCTFIPSNQTTTDNVAIYIAGSSGNLSINNCNAWGDSIRAYLIQEGGRVTISNAYIDNFDKSDAAITCLGGTTLMTNLVFAGLFGGTGNYVSAPDGNTGGYVSLSGCHWREGKGTAFESYDPNGIITTNHCAGVPA